MKAYVFLVLNIFLTYIPQGLSFQSLMPSSVSDFTNLRTISKRQNKAIGILKSSKQQYETEIINNRNIFYGYDRPVVLLGCSSATGDELTKLAESLLLKTNSEKLGQVVHIKHQGLTDVWQLIEGKTFQWPSVLILDAGDSMESNVDDISFFNEHARKLYEDMGYLCVYVNVHSSILQENTIERKAKLENDTFLKYSDYEICIRDEGFVKDDTNNWEHIEWEFSRLLARAKLIPAIPGDKEQSANSAHLTMGQHTFFLSLSFSDVKEAEPYVEEMCQDIDAMEYRVDLLQCRESRFDLLYGMQLLRKYCRPYAIRSAGLPFGDTLIEDNMPIVFTVRTKNQAGTYPDDDKGITTMFELLSWGLRGGVEILDVESGWDATKTTSLLNRAQERYSSQILGSYHVVGKQIDIEDAVDLFTQCRFSGRAHGVKVVLSIESEAKDRMAYEAGLIASELAAMDGEPDIPTISLILGEVGQFSRVINFAFTPVTHQSLPFAAAPGQLTASEILTVRLLTGLLTKQQYCILGHNIAYSVSPQMHGAAFAATKLPHEYTRFDVSSVEDFIESEFFKSEDFGGASVTIPHKQSIMPYVDVITDAAKAIGSVNTLLVKKEFANDEFKRVIYGYNTDWLGIYRPLSRLLQNSVDSESDYALILGAGGTARAAAYAVSKLGLKCIYYNRTPSNAAILADSFGGSVVDTLEEHSDSGKSVCDILGGKGSLRLIISTLPATSNVLIPEWMLNSDGINPILFDVCYKPYSTPLLEQAEKAGWRVVRGSEMLWEQGTGQFEIWTERGAPYGIMKNTVLKNCLE